MRSDGMTWRHKLSFAWRTVKSWVVDRPFAAGRVIQGRYRIVTVLGVGSYGISYLCKDLAREQEVVLKQVKPTRMQDGKGRPIFEYETEMLASLDHPAIPKLLARFEADGQLFFTMEYMRGKNFEDLIFEEGRRYGEREALAVVRELLDIVAFLHEKGIIHRDVRIPNVILAEGRLRLIDFGLARRLGDSPTLIADDLDAYFEEKQIRREVAYTSDFYALGHFLLFLLYSSYESKDKQERPWEEELSLAPVTQALLRRLLQIEEPFGDAGEVRAALESALAETKPLEFHT